MRDFQVATQALHPDIFPGFLHAIRNAEKCLVGLSDKRKFLAGKFLCLLILGFIQPGWSQLSPGPLAQAHAHLEGVRNCTQCHVLGEKVSNDKCLACHKEISQLLGQQRGYHASPGVKGKECASCHSDHHGRNFTLIRFEEKTFDHKLAGYPLTGAHARIDCRTCHKADFIKDPELKKDRDTYLGLDNACLGCHADYHRKTLSSDCAKCHGTESFVPASLFNHDRSGFPLKGKHRTTACVDCHPKETREGQPFQKFTGLAFGKCTDCHSEVHQSIHVKDCRDCHTEQSFSTIPVATSRFNHKETGFPLRGRHQKLECAACHDTGLPPSEVLRDRKGIKADQCIACHEDPHEGRFGTSCASCHSESSFHEVAISLDFDHDQTDFPLLGRHRAVDCRLCHEEGFTVPVAHESCQSCHEDYHKGEFVRDGKGPDCRECHTVEGFQGSLFTIERHAGTDFPLEGAHQATPCFSCHMKEERWTFSNLDIRCVGCHEDVHLDQIPARYYPGKTCESCHQPTSWEDNHFDHNQTQFPLQGAHGRQPCRECHVPDTGFPYGKFVSLGRACVTCHEDEHRGQFLSGEVVDCVRCHGYDSWKIAFFDHDRTAFPLEGRHKEVSCEGCHVEVEKEGDRFVWYKIERFACADCHK